MGKRFLLAQISDTHVRTDDGGASAANLRRAMAQARDYQADAILITGDLVNDERSDEYAAFAEAINDPCAPVFLLPGNHDGREALSAAFPDHAYLPKSGLLSYAVDRFPVRLVVVDQIVPGETHGLLTREHAQWLDETLAAAPTTPTVLALHHPPFPTGDRLFDTIGLRDGDLLTEVVAHHRQVTRILCGHHHRCVIGQIAHAPVIVAPSSSWAYGLALHEHQAIAPVTREQPGWMLHLWTESAGFSSHFMGL